MATKFIALTEANFPADLKKQREHIRKLHGDLTKAVDAFNPLANTYVQGMAKNAVTLIGKAETPANIKTAAAEALVKLGADDKGDIPNMDNLVYSFRFGTAVVMGEARKSKGESKAAVF